MKNDEKLHKLVSALIRLSKELNKTPSIREFIASGQSKRQILKYKYSNLCRLAGLEPNDFNKASKLHFLKSKPKILIFDLEVAPAIVYSYNFRDAYIDPNSIIQMPYILSYSAKFYGEDKIYYEDTKNNPRDDSKLLKSLSKLINEADYLVGHNLKRFDMPMTKGRLILQEMKPVIESIIFDTFKIAYKHFKLPFYKLSELAKYLNCEHQKLTHSNFPGLSLFIEADKGNPEAFKEMRDYCQTDVLVTEEVFTKLMPWEKQINFMAQEQEIKCSCGSYNFSRDGIRRTKAGAYQLFVCKKCGKTFSEKQNLISTTIRKEILQ